MRLALSLITADDRIQPRVATYAEVAAEYADEMRNGVVFPPVVIFFDGTSHWLADGFHRFYGAGQAELGDIEAEVRQGTFRDAVIFSLSANADHGMRRTNEDKRRAVRRALGLEPTNSNSDIARMCAVSEITVRRHRDELSSTMSKMNGPVRQVTRGATTYPQNTTNIGRRSGPTRDNDRGNVSPPPGPPSSDQDWTPSQTTRRHQAAAGQTVVANMRTDHALQAWAEGNDRWVRCDRRSDWGNPFEMPGDGDRPTVIRNYETYYLPHKPSLLGRIHELGGGKVLGCWCAPEECHCDALVRALEASGEEPDEFPL